MQFQLCSVVKVYKDLSVMSSSLKADPVKCERESIKVPGSKCNVATGKRKLENRKWILIIRSMSMIMRYGLGVILEERSNL